MTRKGRFFEIELKDAHLNWGTQGNSRTEKKRNPYETYLPIAMKHAKDFDIKQGEVFSCKSQDDFFNGPLRASGSQGEQNQYGKNFSKEKDLRALGYWLKDRMQAQPGDKVKVFFSDENSIVLSFEKRQKEE